jgi:hypothetical protein
MGGFTVFGKFQVQISAKRLAILTGGFLVVFLKPFT